MDAPRPAHIAAKKNVPTIYRVHAHLRRVNKRAYEPEIVAIGPYHHNKDSLKSMEEHKARYLDSLLRKKNLSSLEDFVPAAEQKEWEKKARKCYAEPIKQCPEEFMEMLIKDGCFIIKLLRKDLDGPNDRIFNMDWMTSSLQRDLLLFENQIPFFILQELIGLIEIKRENHERLSVLVFKFFWNLYPGGDLRRKGGSSQDNIKHVLDLVYRYFTIPVADASGVCHVDIDKAGETSQLLGCCHRPDYCRLKNKSPNKRDCSLDFICPCFGPSTDQNETEPLIIPSATELRNANVNFKRKKSGTLFEVEFREGVLLMSALSIEDRTECFFRNLIAYEEYFCNSGAYYVSDYVRLLNCLIDSSRDVEILHEVGIVRHWLGDLEVVAKMVNQLTRTISYAPTEQYLYAGTFERINAYCKKGYNRSCAALKRDYCYSPWATVAAFAASAILLFTIIQTVCSVMQTVKLDW